MFRISQEDSVYSISFLTVMIVPEGGGGEEGERDLSPKIGNVPRSAPFKAALCEIIGPNDLEFYWNEVKIDTTSHALEVCS